jgi:hypothetical protein
MRMRNEVRAKYVFVAVWLALLAAKLVLAARLPLFVDEAFYWQEGQHLSWAYSDLPGLTAWMARLGATLGADSTLVLRLPFLLLASLIPWSVMRVTAHEFGALQGWQAGLFAMLLPLAGTLGLLAVPDVVMTLATLMCMDAGSRLLREVRASAALELAIGLGIGALSHYRFIAVLAVGGLVLLAMPAGRRALRDPRVLVAIAFGLAAWTPLLAWNQHNADAGLRFQLVERHPWAFHADGITFLGIQALLVTPLLFIALACAAWRNRDDQNIVAHYFAWLGALVVLGFFALGFLADTERVSFHWPLPGYIALLPLLPALLQRWPRNLRIATTAMAATGLLAVMGYYAMMSMPEVRARTASSRWYQDNFAGWQPLADAVRDLRARMPAGTRLVADNFKIGAELGFALGEPDIPVLPHPLNIKHGRAPQLALWNLQVHGRDDLGDGPLLLVVGASEVRYRELLARYHQLCDAFGPLPPPHVVNVDHGAQRFLLFAMQEKMSGACVTPAMAWIDRPVSGARASAGAPLEIAGWAFKDGVGVARVALQLDGRVVNEAKYGLADPRVRAYWGISNDPQHPNVGFRAQLDTRGLAPGRHWLGLRLFGRDGSVEDWQEQPLDLR